MNKCENLVRKIKSFYEVNIDFSVWQDNIYKVKSSKNKIIELINPDKNSTFLEQISEQIFTLCSVLQERPFVQYQGNSDVAEKVASQVYKKLEYLYNYNQSQKNALPFREPRGTLLVMDRSFDLASPLIHDYTY